MTDKGQFVLKPAREEKWDNVKFILIFLVVLGHVADRFADVSPATGCLRFFIYTFHMPAFLFVSGLFSKKNIDNRRYANISSYLCLYLLIKVLIFVSRWFANGTKPKFELFSSGDASWYAMCLFIMSMLTIATRQVKKGYVFAFSILLALVAGYDNGLGDFLCLSRVIAYYPFFFLGYCLDPKTVSEFFEKRKVLFRIASVVVIAAAFAVIIIYYDDIKDIKYIFTGRNPYCVVKSNCPYAFLYRLACIAVAALLGASVIALAPGKTKHGVIAKIGARSLNIYAVHYPLLVLWTEFVNNRFNLPSLFVSRLLIYEILLTILLVLLCLPVFWGKFIKKITTVPLVSC